jgi:hypothetical protein
LLVVVALVLLLNKVAMDQIHSLVLLFPLEAVEAALHADPSERLKQKVVVLAVEQGIMVLEYGTVGSGNTSFRSPSQGNNGGTTDAGTGG